MAVEEPLEIRVDGRSMAVVMRTPGADRELGAGFLLTEGVIDDVDDLLAVAPCTDPNRPNAHNVLLTRLAPGCDRTRLDRAERTLYLSSSCGICGKASLEHVMVHAPTRADVAEFRWPALRDLEALVRSHQPGFGRTGALHAAAICRPTGEILAAYEDVGRHNAVDKAVGALLLAGARPPADAWLWVSGRVSFEVVQKAHVAGLAAVIAVGAPTSLAVELAQTSNLGLVGFCRDGRANIYVGVVSDE